MRYRDHKRNKKRSSGCSFGAVKLSEHMESGDKADEAEAHDEDDGRRDLESRRIIGVETEHIRARSSASYRAGSASRGTGDATAAHPGGRSCRASRGHDAWTRGRGGGGCLRLRGSSSHESE